MLRKHFIHKGLQIRLVIKLFAIMLFMLFVCGYISYYYASQEVKGNFYQDILIIKDTGKFLTKGVLAGVIFSSVIGLLLVLFLITNKIAGPLLRIKRQLTLNAQGDYTSEIRLRKHDELLDIAENINRSNDFVKTGLAALKKEVKELEVLINKGGGSRGELDAKLLLLKKTLDSFKL